MRLLLAIALLLTSVPCYAQQKVEVQFPTTEEITLVVSQAERAFEQYKNSVTLEHALESSQRDPESLKIHR